MKELHLCDKYLKVQRINISQGIIWIARAHTYKPNYQKGTFDEGFGIEYMFV